MIEDKGPKANPNKFPKSKVPKFLYRHSWSWGAWQTTKHKVFKQARKYLYVAALPVDWQDWPSTLHGDTILKVSIADLLDNGSASDPSRVGDRFYLKSKPPKRDAPKAKKDASKEKGAGGSGYSRRWSWASQWAEFQSSSPELLSLKELGLEFGATVKEIKAAYRKLAHKHHPDKGGSTEAFQAIQAAYEVCMRIAESYSQYQTGSASHR